MIEISLKNNLWKLLLLLPLRPLLKRVHPLE